jgi:hypothetical protein
MIDPIFPSTNERLTLKQATGWFAAGDAFRKALSLLSDGAFRLFAYLCLEADRRTGRTRATHQQLAAALGKSKRAIGIYVAELEAQGLCHVKAGKNQFSGTIIEISENFWPYHRTAIGSAESPEQKSYVDAVREYFLALGCVSGKFGAAETAAAKDLHRRGIPLAVIQLAMLIGACRKYTSWFEGRAPEPIRTLGYFESLIAEIQEKPFPPGYSAYLGKKVRQFDELWKESIKSGKTAQGGGYPGMSPKEIVQ